MAQYIKFKSRRFTLEKDAIKWAKDEKASYKGSTQKIKFETNYIGQDINQWEAVLYMKAD